MSRGFRPLAERAFRSVLAGRTSVEEILRRVTTKQELALHADRLRRLAQAYGEKANKPRAN